MHNRGFKSPIRAPHVSLPCPRRSFSGPSDSRCDGQVWRCSGACHPCRPVSLRIDFSRKNACIVPAGFSSKPTFITSLRRALHGGPFLRCAVLLRGSLCLLLRSWFLPLYAQPPLQDGFEQLLLRNGHRSMEVVGTTRKKCVPFREPFEGPPSRVILHLPHQVQ